MGCKHGVWVTAAHPIIKGNRFADNGMHIHVATKNAMPIIRGNAMSSSDRTDITD